MNNPVSIVTIKSKTPLYRKGELADRIELINLIEVGFDLVSQKDIYDIGDKAIFIQPDYCLSDIPLFESFIRPNGDESKSILGKVEGKPRRIRAKKFNFTKGPKGDIVYSNGILLPYHEVAAYIANKEGFNVWDGIEGRNLQEDLEITKYEEPEKSQGGLNAGASSQFPEGIYKTDEPNIFNLIGKIDFPIVLVGHEKIDGSSITIGLKNGEGFICSRNMRKPLTYKKCVGVRKKTLREKLMFWLKPDLKLYLEIPNESDFVKYGKPYLDKLKNNNLDNFVLRGELNGNHLRGSGNKNNPATKEQPNIKFFGVDYLNQYGIAEKCTVEQTSTILKDYEFPSVKRVFMKQFNSFQEIIDECNNYFKDNLIEGIVVRSSDNKISVKVMNLEYDSKK